MQQTQTKLNLRFLKKNLSVSWLLPLPLTQGLVRGDKGIILVEGPKVTPGAGNDLHGAFKARPLVSRPGYGFRVESRCSQTQ